MTQAQASDSSGKPEAVPPDEPVLISIDAGVATLTLNRPARLNAWTSQMSELFFDLLQQCERDREVRVIVVTGAGKGFCAGMDIEALSQVGTTAPVSDPSVRKADTILGIRKPVIAAINGACVGVGFVIACSCDIRFAAADAKLGTLFTRRGLPSEDGLSWVLPRIVGLAASLDILVSGRLFLAAEAAQLGLVKEVLPAADLMERTLAFARDLADNCSPAAMAMIKRQIYSDLDQDLNGSLRLSRELRDAAVVSADFDEGVASFTQKRSPRFAGLPPAEG